MLKKSVLGALGAALVLWSCASPPPPPPPPPVNLALGKSLTSNGHIYDYVSQAANDGEVLSYFEGPANQYPNLLTLSFREPTPVQRLVFKLNPKRIWGARTQTIEVQASGDGVEFHTVVPTHDYVFDPEVDHNAVTVAWAGQVMALRLVFTANTEATAGQLAEWEVY